MADGHYSLTMRDYSKETSTFRVNVGQVTALTLPGLLTAVGNLRSATEGITLGIAAAEKMTVFDTKLSGTIPSDKEAQIENKWLATYLDATETLGVGVPNPGYGKSFRNEIPTADSALVVSNTDFANLDDGGVTEAFKTAFDAVVKSPYGGAANLISLQYI